MKKILSWIIIMTGLTASFAYARGLRDDAAVFSVQANKQAEDLIDRIYKQSEQDVTIETAVTTPTPVPDNSAARQKYFEDWATRSGPANGVIVIMTKVPQYLRVFTKGNVTVTPEQRHEFSEILLKNFRNNQFDSGLIQGVSYLEYQTRPSSHLFFWLLLIIGISVAIFLFLRKKIENEDQARVRKYNDEINGNSASSATMKVTNPYPTEGTYHPGRSYQQPSTTIINAGSTGGGFGSSFAGAALGSIIGNELSRDEHSHERVVEREVVREREPSQREEKTSDGGSFDNKSDGGDVKSDSDGGNYSSSDDGGSYDSGSDGR